MDRSAQRECRSCQEVFTPYTCFTCRRAPLHRHQQGPRGVTIENRCRECHDEIEHHVIDCRHLVGRRRRR